MHLIPFVIGIVLGGLAAYLYMHKSMLKKAEVEISAEIAKLRGDYAAARTKFVSVSDSMKAAPATMGAKLVATENKL